MIEEIAMEQKVPRVIVHSHSAGIDEGVPKLWEERVRVHESFKQQFSMKYATDVWACSAAAAKWLYGANIPSYRIRIMPNAIDIERYRFQPEKRFRLRQQMGLEDKLVVGNIGRYAFQKNQEFLLRVFAAAYGKDNRLHLLCLGEGEMLPRLRRLAETLGIEKSVSLIGWQKNAEDYLQVMDVFCLPSRFEGLPISVVEAQAAGLKCLVADTVTEEVKLTDLVSFLPLEEEQWVQELLHCNIQNHRECRDEEIIRAGYEIQSAAKKLEEMYEGTERQR